MGIRRPVKATSLNHAMQAGLAGAPKEAPRKGQRKIRPTVPVLATGRAPSVAVPAAVSRMAAGEQDEAKQALRSTFLAMYSNSESKACLRARLLMYSMVFQCATFI